LLALGEKLDTIVVGTGPYLYAGAVRPILQGGSIALVVSPDTPDHDFKNWGIFAPGEVNPGRFETKRGIIVGPLNSGTTDVNGKATISVIWLEESIKYRRYQFQICRDPACEQIVTDTVREYGSYFLETPVPPGTTYYWRARHLYEDGSFSLWSEVRSITNKQPK
jgi:hypothetical protein